MLVHKSFKCDQKMVRLKVFIEAKHHFLDVLNDLDSTLMGQILVSTCV